MHPLPWLVWIDWTGRRGRTALACAGDQETELGEKQQHKMSLEEQFQAAAESVKCVLLALCAGPAAAQCVRVCAGR